MSKHNWKRYRKHKRKLGLCTFCIRPVCPPSIAFCEKHTEENRKRVKGLTYLYNSYRTNAYRGRWRRTGRGNPRVFTLSKEEFKTLVTNPCFHCGVYPKHRKFGGIDRLKNWLGYTKENSVPCCKDCNMSKRSNTAKHFYEHCKRVFIFQFGKDN